jgi:hypothetical protein
MFNMDKYPKLSVVTNFNFLFPFLEFMNAIIKVFDWHLSVTSYGTTQ